MEILRGAFSEYGENILVGLLTYVWMFIWDMLSDRDNFGFMSVIVVAATAGVIAERFLPVSIIGGAIIDSLTDNIIIPVITLLLVYRSNIARILSKPVVCIPLLILGGYYAFSAGYDVWAGFENERRKNLPEIAGLYHAAENGDAPAQNGIGMMYLEGKIFVKSYKDACYWFERSASQGFAAGEYNYACMLDNGCGINQDKAKAFRWYMKAAGKGFPQAQNRVGVMLGNGEGVSKNMKKSQEWYTLAADNGNKYAMANLGYLHAYVLKRDYRKAYMYYYASSLAGNNEAEEKLSEFMRKNYLSKSQRDTAEKEAREFIGRLKSEGKL